MKPTISICGSDSDDKNLSNYALQVAEKIGRLIAERGGVILCGGRGGVMEAACRGAKQANGITVGILPFGKKEANEYIDIAIPTNLGNARNYLVAQAGDVTIAICGRWGTLSEIAFCSIYKKPLILVKGTGGVVDEIINGNIIKNFESNYLVATSAEDAVEKAFYIISSNK